MKVFSPRAPTIRSTFPAVGLILLISVPLLGAVLFLSWWLDVPVGDLTGDIASVARTQLYIGMLSSIGMLFWTATATLCIFSAMLVTGRQNEVMLKQFLYLSGLFTLLLLFDDLFLLHERVFPNVIGLPEEAVLGGYALFALAYLIRSRTVIFATEYPLLGLALFFFGISVVIDVVFSEVPGTAALDDFAKFVGIVSWFVYYARVSTFALHPESSGS